MRVEENVQLQPVSDDDTEDVEGELDGDEGASRRVGRRLGGPDWGHSIENAGSNAVQHASCMSG